MIFISVDLPAPFSPRTAWICPGATRRLTRSLAFTAGYDLLMSTSSRRSIEGYGESAAVAIVMGTAGDERLDEVAFVGQRHPGEDALMQGAGHGGAPGRHGADRGVPDADVRHRADVERPDLAVEAERPRRAARRRVQRLPRRQPLA